MFPYISYAGQLLHSHAIVLEIWQGLHAEHLLVKARGNGAESPMWIDEHGALPSVQHSYLPIACGFAPSLSFLSSWLTSIAVLRVT
jgi:hypothetical protein